MACKLKSRIFIYDVYIKVLTIFIIQKCTNELERASDIAGCVTNIVIANNFSSALRSLLLGILSSNYYYCVVCFLLLFFI